MPIPIAFQKAEEEYRKAIDGGTANAAPWPTETIAQVPKGFEAFEEEYQGAMGPPKERGLFGEVSSAIAKGGFDTAEMYARAARTLGYDTTGYIDSINEMKKGYEPSKHGPVWDAVTQGISSTVQSIGGGVPGTAIGLVGGPFGAVAGFAGSAGTLFSLAEYDQFLEEAERAGIPRDSVTDKAIISAIAEGGIEAATDLIGGKILGIGRPLKGIARQGLLNAFKKLTGKTLKLGAVEVPGEMVTSAIQAAERQEAGIPTEMPWQAAKSAFGPSLVQTAIMGPLGLGVGRLQRGLPPQTQTRTTEEEFAEEDFEKVESEETPEEGQGPESQMLPAVVRPTPVPLREITPEEQLGYPPKGTFSIGPRGEWIEGAGNVQRPYPGQEALPEPQRALPPPPEVRRPTIPIRNVGVGSNVYYPENPPLITPPPRPEEGPFEIKVEGKEYRYLGDVITTDKELVGRWQGKGKDGKWFPIKNMERLRKLDNAKEEMRNAETIGRGTEAGSRTAGATGQAPQEGGGNLGAGEGPVRVRKPEDVGVEEEGRAVAKQPPAAPITPAPLPTPAEGGEVAGEGPRRISGRPGQAVTKEYPDLKIAVRHNGKVFTAKPGETHADIVVNNELPFKNVETGFIDKEENWYTSIGGPPEAVKTPSLLSQITSLQRPGQSRDLVSISELRDKAGLSQEEFDRQLSELAGSGQVSLHRHDFPFGMSEEKRNKLYSEPDATSIHRGRAYYGGVVPTGKDRKGPATPSDTSLSVATGSPSGLPLRTIESALSPLRARIKGIEIKAVEKVEDLPASVLGGKLVSSLSADSRSRIRGVHSINNGKSTIYIVGSSMSKPTDVHRTALHELMGHEGLMRAMEGKAYNSFLDRLHEAKKGDPLMGWIKDNYRFGENEEGHRKAADEWFARKATEDYGKPDVRPWWNRFVAIFRDWLRRMGFKLQLTEREIADVIRRARRAVERERPTGKAEGQGLSMVGAAGDINSPEFKRWFGKSKVVDENGKPLVVYHGTDKIFRWFSDTFDLGFHFGSSEQAAYKHGRNKGSNIIPAYLSIKNPARLPDHAWDTPETLASSLKKFDRDGKLDAAAKTWREISYSVVSEDMTVEEYKKASIELRSKITDAKKTAMALGRGLLEQAGYDGVIYKNEVEGGGNSYIAFSPTQIKSVFNRGTWDAENPDISLSMKERGTREGMTTKGEGRIPATPGKAESGKILYHGSPTKFDRIEIGKPSPRDSRYTSAVITLTDDPKLANRYAGKTGTVGEYRVDLKNPIDLGNGEATMTVATFLKNINSPKTAEELNLNPTGWVEQWRMISYSPEIVKILKDQGYDGAIWKENKGKSTTYAIFSVDQVKPAASPKAEGGEDAFQQYDSNLKNAYTNILRSAKAAKEGEKQAWHPIPISKIKQIWKSFSDLGFVRNERVVNDLADDMVAKIVTLDANTTLMGHTAIDPAEALDAYGLEMSEALSDKLTDYLTTEKGNWRLSDYGLEKLQKIAIGIIKAKTPEEKLLLMDQALNVVHQREDLSSWFVEGGRNSLDELAGKSPNPTRPPESGGQVSLDLAGEPDFKDTIRKSPSGTISLSGVAESFDKIKDAVATSREGLLSKKDISFLEENVRLPHWRAKDDPQFTKVYNNQEGRDTIRNLVRNDLTEALLPALKLKGDRADKLGALLWRGDALRSELKEEALKKLPADMREAYLAVREVLDYIWTEDLPNLMKQLGTSDLEIEEYRKKFGKVKGYMPHFRKGRYFVRATRKAPVTEYAGKDGEPFKRKQDLIASLQAKKKGAIYQPIQVEGGWVGRAIGWVPESELITSTEVLYREHFDDLMATLTRLQAPAKGTFKKLKVQEMFPDAEVEIGRVTKLPEEVFFQASPAAEEQIVDAAMDRLKMGGDKEAVRDALKKAISEVIQSRGFMAHGLPRQGIPGFDKKNWKEALIQYVSSYAGFKSKLLAAPKFNEALRGIDAKTYPSRYAYASKYIHDVMKNAEMFDQTMDKARGFMFYKYLGGVVKSATLQLTQNYIAGVPRLSRETRWPAEKITMEMARAGQDVLKSLYNKSAKENRLGPDIMKGINVARKKGIIADQWTEELMGYHLGTYGSALRGLSNAMRFMFGKAEIFNRETLYAVAYRIAQKEKGMTPQKAQDFAEEIVKDVHFVYGKSNLPPITRGGKVATALRGGYTFRTYTHQLMALYRQEIGKGNYLGVMKGLLSLMAFAGLVGIPLYKDIEDLIQRMTDKNIRVEVAKRAGRAKNLALYGLPGLAGVDLTGSISIEKPTNLIDLGGVMTQVPKDVMSTIEDLSKMDLKRAMEDFPITPSVLKYIMVSRRMGTRGLTTRSGSAIPDENGQPIKLNRKEQIWKMIGFQPVKVSESYRIEQAMNAHEKLWQDRKGKLLDAYAIEWNETQGKGSKKLDDILNRMIDLQGKMPVDIPPITPVSIMEHLNKRRTKREAYRQYEFTPPKKTADR